MAGEEQAAKEAIDVRKKLIDYEKQQVDVAKQNVDTIRQQIDANRSLLDEIKKQREEETKKREAGLAKFAWSLTEGPGRKSCRLPMREKGTATAAVRASPAALEELHGALVLLGRRTRPEGAEVAPPSGLRVGLARIEPVLARLELADHGNLRRRMTFILIDAGAGKRFRPCPLRRSARAAPAEKVAWVRTAAGRAGSRAAAAAGCCRSWSTA